MMQVWLEKTLQKLDSLLLGVCQEFKQEGYITVSVLIFWNAWTIIFLQTVYAWSCQF